MLVKWNLTRHLNHYKSADVLVLSIGKSGRTWLRVLLNKFLSLHFDVPFGIGDLSLSDRRIPSILYEHEAWSHFCDASWFKRVVGRNIAPDGVLRQKKVVLLYRDPRDVVVSLYFQKTKRSRKKIDCDIKTFIRDKKNGIANIVSVMNLWRGRLQNHPSCFWLSYEALKSSPQGELQRLLDFVGIKGYDQNLCAEAVAFADFENMQVMERDNKFQSRILSARDISDPDSYKVREGKTGGYIKHFDDDQIYYLDEVVSLLDKFYNYTPTISPGQESF